MNHYINKILETPFFRNVFKLSLSSVIVMVVSVVVTPILSRIYTPEDFGEWGLFSSVVLIVSSMIFLSYENAIVKTDKKEELSGLIQLCLVIAITIILITAIVFVAGFLFRIKFFINFPSVFFLVVALSVTVVQSLLSNIANRYSRYTDMSISGLISGLSQPATRMLLGLVPVKFGLIIGNIFSILLSVSYFFIKLKKIIIEDIARQTSFYELRSLAIKYKKFPLYEAPARLLDFTIGNIVIIILSMFFDLKDIGCFSMICQLVLIPLTLMGSSMSTVFFKDLSAVGNNQEEVRLISIRMFRICFLLSFFPCIFLILGGDKLIVLFLGSKWALAGDMALCLAVFSIPVLLSEPLLPIFKVLEKQNVRLWLNILYLSSIVAAIVLGAVLKLNILQVLVFYAVINAFVRFIMLFFQMKYTRVRFHDFYKEFLIVTIIYLFLFFRIIFMFVND